MTLKLFYQISKAVFAPFNFDRRSDHITNSTQHRCYEESSNDKEKKITSIQERMFERSYCFLFLFLRGSPVAEPEIGNVRNKGLNYYFEMTVITIIAHLLSNYCTACGWQQSLGSLLERNYTLEKNWKQNLGHKHLLTSLPIATATPLDSRRQFSLAVRSRNVLTTSGLVAARSSV